MESIPYSHLEKGAFLISSPDLESGFFSRSVVLVCEHSPGGSFGLIVNKSLELELPEELFTMEELKNPRVSIRAGGPAQTNQMMIIHSFPHLTEQSMEICQGVWLGGDLQFLQESIAQEDGPSLLLCFGYTGWQAGQLEREFLDGNWFLHPAKKEHLFETPPEKLWQVLLREMGGKYATLSMMPEDLSVN